MKEVIKAALPYVLLAGGFLVTFCIIMFLTSLV